MRTHLFSLLALLFLVCALGATAVADVSATDSAANIDVPASVMLESAAADECTAPADIAFEAEAGAAYECANDAYCRFDAQCNTFCGGSGGACEFGCCSCAF
ncbi:hypothetical protein [Haliangium ochraceum]|uniref:Uncharacterized protein n=1 Tax=Haliangium ochraceum (strain DSM 14365 / JCM 11303 / SMP-2) TaxID=502025 RepID=D0LMA6_HALO1|nr:hypothetical protein [Haliangium ochraceum]ACY16812.1 hypothetical protein Hoch_4317 [Haliangium ochraceum DSM 14365]